MECQKYYTQDDRGRCIPCQDLNACVNAKDSSFAMDNCKRYCEEWIKDFLNKSASSDLTLHIVLGTLLGCVFIVSIVSIVLYKQRRRCRNQDILKKPIPVSETNSEQLEASQPAENQQLVFQI